MTEAWRLSADGIRAPQGARWEERGPRAPEERRIPSAERCRAGRSRIRTARGAEAGPPPPSASRPMKDLVGSEDYSEVSFRGGHIGIYVSGRAQKEVPQTIHEWLAKRSR